MNMIPELLNGPLVPRVGWALVHSLWQGALAAVLFEVLRLALRRHSAQARYLAGCAMLLLVAAAPVVTFCGGRVAMPAQTHNFAAERITGAGNAAPALQIEETSAMSPGRPSLHNEILDRLEQALPWLVLGWGIGVAGFACRWLYGSFWVRRIKRLGATEIHEPFVSTLEDLRKRLCVTRPVRLLQSTLVEVPMVVGWLRPVILLPASILSGLTPTELEVILAHELAHVRRLDYVVNTFQNLVETVMFYHPVVWWISNCIREEREHCCDDLVVRWCGNKLAYARALVSLEEMRGPRLAFAASGGPLLGRVRRLLSGAGEAKPLGARELGGLVVAGVGGLLLLLGVALTCRPAKFQAGALIRVEPDRMNSAMAGGIDPRELFFVQTELAILRSPVVLGRGLPVPSEGLPSGRRSATRKLSIEAAVAQLSSRLDVRQLRGTTLVRIQAWDPSPAGAAEIANGVAAAYGKYRAERRNRAAQEGISAVESALAQVDKRIETAQKQAEALRLSLQISDAQVVASSPEPLLTAESLRRLESLRIESVATLTRDRVLLAKLRQLKPEELYLILPIVAPEDAFSTSLVQGLAAAEQKVEELKVDFTPEHPQMVKALGRVKDYQQRLRQRADGFTAGLEAKTSSLQESVKQLESEVEHAKMQDIELVSRTRPYWDARRQIEEQKKLREALAQKLASEQLDAEMAQGVGVELIEKAVAPIQPSRDGPPAAASMALGLLLSIFGIWMTRTSGS